MGILSRLIGGSAVEAAKGVADVVDRFVETPDEKRVAEQLRARMEAQPALAQIEINKIEAAHRSIFVAGWRPAIGWACCIGLIWQFMGHDLAQWVLALAGSDIEPPTLIGTEMLGHVVMAMLGFGAMRTFEKSKGMTQ